MTELHLGAGPDILVPDLAGWRRAWMPEMPDAPFLDLAPDWACEVLSPSTREVDRTEKVPIFAREQVRHLWLLDPEPRTLEVLELDGTGYRTVATHTDDVEASAPPFEVVQLPPGVLRER